MSGNRKSTRNTVKGVARRLGVAQLTPRSTIMSLLSYAAARFGGKEMLMDLASRSTDLGARKATSLWHGLSKSDRRYVGLDDLCAAAEIRPDELVGAVVAVGFREGIDVSPLLSAPAEQQQLLEAAFERAESEEGWRERKRLLTHIWNMAERIEPGGLTAKGTTQPH